MIGKIRDWQIFHILNAPDCDLLEVEVHSCISAAMFFNSLSTKSAILPRNVPLAISSSLMASKSRIWGPDW
jgi:hypothetical protein